MQQRINVAGDAAAMQRLEFHSALAAGSSKERRSKQASWMYWLVPHCRSPHGNAYFQQGLTTSTHETMSFFLAVTGIWICIPPLAEVVIILYRM